MILTSVDLPAPLSPSNPSTSPLRRCRLRSRSAVIGPKRLAMCSRRSTSSDAELGPTMCSSATVWSGTSGPGPNATDKHVQAHGDDDRDPEVEILVVGVHALERQPVLEDPDEQSAEQRADDRALAAGHQR